MRFRSIPDTNFVQPDSPHAWLTFGKCFWASCHQVKSLFAKYLVCKKHSLPLLWLGFSMHHFPDFFCAQTFCTKIFDACGLVHPSRLMYGSPQQQDRAEWHPNENMLKAFMNIHSQWEVVTQQWPCPAICKPSICGEATTPSELLLRHLHFFLQCWQRVFPCWEPHTESS